MKKTMRFLCIALALMLVLCSCGVAEKPVVPEYSMTEENSAEVSRPNEVSKPQKDPVKYTFEIPAGSNAVLLSAPFKASKNENTSEISEEFISAMSDFSMKLFASLAKDDGKNDLVSPLSAIICLAMLANGADGNTKAEMEAAFGVSIDDLNENLYALTSSLYSSEKCKVDIADSIWFRDEENRLHVNDEFLQINADIYGADAVSAPFDETTVDLINDWVKANTDGLIDGILEEIPEEAVMYLINTLLFDAEWSTKYAEESVRKSIFHGKDGTQETDFMYSGEHIYLTDGKAEGFAKSYVGGGYYFVALLPEENEDVYDFISGLTGEKWLSMWKSRRTGVSVSTGMPKFEYDSDMTLTDTLKAMGMKDLFNDEEANLSKLGCSENGNLYCSLVGQKAYIKVDTFGTKAGAVTWGEVCEATDMPEEFHTVILDSPFVYAIVDYTTGLPLFVGAVTTVK